MPSKKVRRRRQKLKRHEYEYVVETEEGEQVVERPVERERDSDVRAVRGGPVDRRGRPIAEPTLKRSLRRTIIFAPLIYLFVYLNPLGGEEVGPGQALISSLVILGFFLPFSYFADRLIYNALNRKQRARAGR